MFKELQLEAERLLLLGTLEETVTYIRSLKLVCAGMFASFPADSVQAKDAGAAFVHTNDILNWLESRLVTARLYESGIGATPAKEATADEPKPQPGEKAVIH